MVHALQEVWRVLSPDGALIDLRPVSNYWPVEVIDGERVSFAGRIDDSVDALADRDAENALSQIERGKLFAREREAPFIFMWYWDTLDEMLAYAKERWTNTRLPDETVAEAKRLMSSAAVGAKIRIRANMIITRWSRSCSRPPRATK